MKKAIKIGLIIALIIIVLIAAYSIYFNSRESSPPTSPQLQESELIIDSAAISRIVNDMKSPLGTNLTKMVIDSEDSNIRDDSWAYDYYVCNDNEHLGWRYIHNGKTGDNKLYGPYAWCLM